MRSTLASCIALLALAGCRQPKDASVGHAWVRLAPVPSRPAAAYFTIHGGPTDRTLIDVASDVAIRAEMHETMTAGNMSQMKPLPQIAVPARTDVAFAPGGRHVMLFNLAPTAKPGTTVPLTLVFGDGERITVAAKAVAAGDPAP